MTFDPRALTEPVTAADARAFTKALRASGRLPSSTSATAVVAVILGGVFVLVFLGTFATILSAFAAAMTSSGGPGAAGLLALLPFAVIPVVIVLIVVLMIRSGSVSAVRRLRLDRFALANDMGYLPVVNAPNLPGMIFGLGSGRVAEDVVRGDRPRFVEFANYRYTTGSGKNRTTHRWGYIAVRLDVPLPHIVLDATSNNALFGSNLPIGFDKDQRLSLEGDFDRHFALYCPRDYETDALYLFTPDIMARFIDNAAALDVEIVDDWLFLYTRRTVSTLDPATWAWQFSVVGALLDKFAQWARWRDERLNAPTPILPAPILPTATAAASGSSVPSPASPGAPFAPPPAAPFVAPPIALRPPPGVAPQGRRLSRRFPVIAVILAGVFVAVWLFQVLSGGLLASFLR